MAEWFTLAGLILAVLGAGATGGLFPPGSWYDALDKPSWTPPNWLFPLAWAFLYAVMIYSAWRVAQHPTDEAAPALSFWAAQIVFNAIWTPVFFGLRRLGAALVIVVVLWLCVLATIILSAQVDLAAGLLLIPYLIWVSYAAALNAVIWRTNPMAAELQGS